MCRESICATRSKCAHDAAIFLASMVDFSETNPARFFSRRPISARRSASTVSLLELRTDQSWYFFVMIGLMHLTEYPRSDSIKDARRW
jgi:hypothetical protein